MPYGTKLEGALICNLNFIFCHYTMNHPIHHAHQEDVHV